MPLFTHLTLPSHTNTPPSPRTRGLFESHKMIFSFLICTSIQRDAGTVDPRHWNFLLRGARGPDPPKPLPPACAAWLSQPAWLAAQSAERVIPELAQLTQAITVKVGGGKWVCPG